MADRVAAMRHDILNGPITASVTRLAWPVAASMVLQTLFGIIDAVWVGHLGPAALAGVSTGGFAIWAMFSLMAMVSVGLNALVARHIGAGHADRAAEIAGQGVLLASLIGLMLAIGGWLGLDYLFHFMRTAPEVTAQGKAYLTPILLIMPVLFAFSAVNAVFSGAGDTQTTMRLSAGAVLLAGVLDPLLIYGLGPFPRLEVRGAALATVISRVIFFVAGLALLVRRSTGIGIVFPRSHIDAALWWRIVRIGAPASVSGVVASLVYVGLTRITTTFGTPAVAALGACHRIEGLNYLLGVGFAAAAAAYVGQNLGARQPERAECGAWRAYQVLVLPVGILALLFFAIPDVLLRAFTSDPKVISAGASYLRIVALAQLFQGLELVFDGAFGGAANTLPAMVISTPLSIARYPLSVILAGPVGMSVHGVWWAISSTTIAKGTLMAYWFSRGRWKNTQV